MASRDTLVPKCIKYLGVDCVVRRDEVVDQPPKPNKINLKIAQICTGGRQNPGFCGSNEGSRQRRFAARVRAGEVECIVGWDDDQNNLLVPDLIN